MYSMREKNRHIDWEIIRKAAIGEASSDEQAQLAQWLEESADNRAYFEKACRFYAKANQRTSLGKQGAQKRLRLVSIGAQIAAVAAVFISFVYVLMPERGQEATVDYVEAVLPLELETKHVVLTLPGGEQVCIDPEKEQMVLNNEDTMLMESGAIAYHAKEEVQQELIYHTIEVPSGTTYKIVLNDGSTVQLNAQSSLTYPVSFALDAREVSLEGEAFFEVKKDGRPFTVSVQGKEVRVLGTSFNVEAYTQGQVKTCLVSGSVQMVDEFENKVLLKPGEMAHCAEDGIKIEQADKSQVLAWREGNFSFQQEKLGEIMQQLARWYDVEVSYAEEGLKELVFTGTVQRSEPIEKIMSYFARTNNVDFSFRDNTIIVKQNKKIISNL